VLTVNLLAARSESGTSGPMGVALLWSRIVVMGQLIYLGGGGVVPDDSPKSDTNCDAIILCPSPFFCRYRSGVGRSISPLRALNVCSPRPRLFPLFEGSVVDLLQIPPR